MQNPTGRSPIQALVSAIGGGIAKAVKGEEELKEADRGEALETARKAYKSLKSYRTVSGRNPFKGIDPRNLAFARHERVKGKDGEADKIIVAIPQRKGTPKRFTDPSKPIIRVIGG